MADLGLADSMDAAEALLQPVRVPRKVVVHHQVSALKVDALARCVGGHQDLDRLVVCEAFLDLSPFVSPDSAVDRDDRVRPADQAAYAVDEVVEGVAVLGEDHQLSAMPMRVEHFPLVEEEGPQFVPLPIVSAVANAAGLLLEALQDLDLGFQLGDRASRRGLIEDLLFFLLDLAFGRLVEVIQVFKGQVRNILRLDELDLCSPVQEFLLGEALLETFAAPSQRLVDRLG